MENKHKEFKPFDKVVVREGKSWPWRATFYSHYYPVTYHHYTTSGAPINDILPYEGNEHLVGTTDEPEEEIKLEEGEYGFFVTKPLMENPSYYSFGQFSCTTNNCMMNSANFYYDCFIRFCDFNPNDMEETKKYILCVKNGRIIRYKG